MKVYFKSNIYKILKFKFNLSENLGSVKFYFLKNNEYYIKLISFIIFMKFNDFVVKRYVDYEIFYLIRLCFCFSCDK